MAPRNKRSRSPSRSNDTDPIAQFKDQLEKHGRVDLGDVKKIFLDFSTAVQHTLKEKDKEDNFTEINKKMDSIANSMVDFTSVTNKMTVLIEKIDLLADEQKSLNAAIQKIAQENQDLRAENNLLKDRIISLEINELKGNLIIRNVPQNHNADAEKRTENLEEASDSFFYKVLQPLELDGIITNFTAFRIPLRTGHPLLKIQLQNPAQKSLLFRALGTKGNQLKDRIVVKNEYPKSLLQELKTLEERAYTIRQENKGTKTRIALRNNKLKLLTKTPDQNKFAEL